MKNLTLVIQAKKEEASLPSVLREIKDFDCSIIIILEEQDKPTIEAVKDFDCKIIFQNGVGYGNALIQGIKKANIVMYLTLGRMVIMPLIVLSYLIFFLDSSFEFVFWGLLIINWIFGIFVFILTKSIIKKQIKINKINLINKIA